MQFTKTYKKKAVEFWNKALWTDETKINLYLNDGKEKVWRGKGTAYDQRHSTSPVKHGASVMAWACMAANGTGTLAFIDDFTADRGNRMNAEVSRTLLCAHIRTNASKLIGRQS